MGLLKLNSLGSSSGKGIRQTGHSSTVLKAWSCQSPSSMSVMMTLPILLMFFVGQRYFVRGVVMSGIKG